MQLSVNIITPHHSACWCNSQSILSHHTTDPVGGTVSQHYHTTLQSRWCNGQSTLSHHTTVPVDATVSQHHHTTPVPVDAMVNQHNNTTPVPVDAMVTFFYYPQHHTHMINSHNHMLRDISVDSKQLWTIN